MANEQQLALLKKCSKARDCSEWNAWLEAEREEVLKKMRN